MDDGASLSALPLPVVDLSQEAEKGFLGVGHVTVGGPAQELEVTHHQLALLKLQHNTWRGRFQWCRLPIKICWFFYSPQLNGGDEGVM